MKILLDSASLGTNLADGPEGTVALHFHLGVQGARPGRSGGLIFLKVVNGEMALVEDVDVFLEAEIVSRAGTKDVVVANFIPLGRVGLSEELAIRIRAAVRAFVATRSQTLSRAAGARPVNSDGSVYAVMVPVDPPIPGVLKMEKQFPGVQYAKPEFGMPYGQPWTLRPVHDLPMAALTDPSVVLAQARREVAEMEQRLTASLVQGSGLSASWLPPGCSSSGHHQRP